MALKVDLSGVKTLFFERGEKIGMIACLAAAVVLVGYGVMSGMGAKSTSSGVPYTTAIENHTKRARGELQRGQEVPSVPPSNYTATYPYERPNFLQGSLYQTYEDTTNTKRLNPLALNVRSDPKFFQMDYVRGAYFKHDINHQFKTATVIKDAKVAVPVKGFGNFPGGKNANAILQPVKAVEPKRMLVVNAVFPLTEQLEEFRKKFRMQHPAELFASNDLPRFLGINVMKCEMTPGKEPVWTPLIFSSFDNAKQTEKIDIDPALMQMLREAYFDETLGAGAPFAFQGLVMPLPLLATLPLGQTYPKVDLEGIDFMWAEMLEGVVPGAPGVNPMPRPRPEQGRGGPRGGPGMQQPMLAPGMVGAGGVDIEFENVKWAKLVPDLADKFNDKFYPIDPLGIPRDPDEGAVLAPNAPNAPQIPQQRPVNRGNMNQAQAGQSPFAAAAQWPKYPYPPLPANLAPGGVQQPVQPVRPENNAAVNTKPYEALVRFVDVDVKPGKSYKYMIQVRIANPNYKKMAEVAFAALAEPKELSPANPVETPVKEIPLEYFLYAIDQKPANAKVVGGSDDKDAKDDQVAVQIHRWADRTADRDTGAEFVIGDWAIAERLLLRRGDPIGRTTNVEIPIWDKKLGTFDLGLSMIGMAAPVGGKKKDGMQFPPKDFGKKQPPKKDGAGGAELASAGVPIDFSESTPPSVLADFNGGKAKIPGGKGQFDESASDLLILNADGRLIVRNTRADSEPDTAEFKLRQQRIEDWKAKVAPFRPAVDPANPAMPAAPNPFLPPPPRKGAGG